MLLLMDEVDGMHGANDRGGAATLAKMIQKTKVSKGSSPVSIRFADHCLSDPCYLYL